MVAARLTAIVVVPRPPVTPSTAISRPRCSRELTPLRLPVARELERRADLAEIGRTGDQVLEPGAHRPPHEIGPHAARHPDHHALGKLDRELLGHLERGVAGLGELEETARPDGGEARAGGRSRISPASPTTSRSPTPSIMWRRDCRRKLSDSMMSTRRSAIVFLFWSGSLLGVASGSPYFLFKPASQSQFQSLLGSPFGGRVSGRFQPLPEGMGFTTRGDTTIRSSVFST